MGKCHILHIWHMPNMTSNNEVISDDDNSYCETVLTPKPFRDKPMLNRTPQAMDCETPTSDDIKHIVDNMNGLKHGPELSATDASQLPLVQQQHTEMYNN